MPVFNIPIFSRYVSKYISEATKKKHGSHKLRSNVNVRLSVLGGCCGEKYSILSYVIFLNLDSRGYRNCKNQII